MKKIACLGAMIAACAAFAGNYTWNGASGGDWATPGNWLVGGEVPSTAPTSADNIEFNSASALTVGGSTTLAITQIANTGAGTVTFACPVQFSGTYYVTQNGPVKFPGGATATHPDPALRTAASTDRARTLDGDFTFTEDWVVNNVGDYPWIIPSGSTVHGRLFTGTQTAHHRILRVEEGASAYFSCVSNGWNMGDVDIDGYVEVSGEYVVQTATSGSTPARFGRAGNIGTVKAYRIVKYRGSIVSQYVPNLIVGAGGFGSLSQNYYWRVEVDSTITFTDNCDIYGPYSSSNPLDWGIYLNSVTLTVNVPEGKTVTWSSGIRAAVASAIRKIGAGTLVMTDTNGVESGFKKTNSQITFIEEGTVRAAADDQMGTGSLMVADGARLEIGRGTTVSNWVEGAGTLCLENGVTLALGRNSWRMGAVEVADGASVTLTTASTPVAPYALLTGVAANDLARFSYAGGSLAVLGGALTLPYAVPMGAYVWAGASGGDWATPGNWLVDGATPASAPGSGDTILFQNDVALTVGGTGTLTVTKIVTLSGAEVTFACPVAFAGTYLVNNAATPPRFAGGATATIPDATLTAASPASRILSGNVAFTQDWTIPLQDTPFIVSAGSTLTGKELAATTYNSGRPELRIDAGAVATFDTVTIGGKLVFWLNGGRLVATGDLFLGGDADNRDFGYYGYCLGTVEANGLYKNVTSVGTINSYITNMVVGAGGFGMKRKDYKIVFKINARLTAKDDLTIWEPQELGTTAPRDTDWGLNLNGKTFTVDTAGHTVYFDSYVTNGVIVKEGTGEMIMRSRQKKHFGGTVINGGTVTVVTIGSLGYGLTTVNNGATLRFTDAGRANAYPIEVMAGGTLANDVSVSETSTLTLHAGVTLRPVQNTYFDVSSGTLVLPDEGTITVDMTDFSFVNGVATPVLVGASAGDEAKFVARVPEGVSGVFSVADGFLSYTPTSGGGAAANLFWHPLGEATWSEAVAAWTNAAGEQVAFSPYANATVADAATISLPADVEANDVTVSADANVTLNGAGKLGGPGTIVKTGAGTFTFNATGGLDAQTIIVSNGVFKMGEDLTGPLGSTADSSPIVVADGGTLDINYNSTDNYDPARHSLTHDKLIRIAGDGVDGKGAIVSTNKQCYIAFSDVELTDDATIGGTVRSDFRHSTAYGSVRGTTSNSLTGPGKCLTVKNTAMLALVGTTVDLGSIVVAEGANLRAEGNTAGWNLDEGVKLRGGTFSMYGTTCDAKISVVAESGSNTIVNGNGTATVNGPVTVAPGATLTQTGGSIVYNGPISGDFDTAGGTVFLTGALRDGLVLNCTKTGGSGSDRSIRLRQGGTFSNVDITCRQLGIADQSNSVVNVTFLDSKLDINRLFLGWGSVWSSAYMSIGEGTTLTTTLIDLAYDGTSTNKERSVLSVDGGTLHHTGTEFYIAKKGPHAEFLLNSGTATVDKATIWLRSDNAKQFGGWNTARFVQNGGTFNYGGAGFNAKYEDNTDGGQIVLKGGEFNASANWSIPSYIPLFFGYEANEGWTLNQKDGTTATWTTALLGNGDVTLNGAAELVGTNEVQGAVGGKWTVGNGFTAGLEGAASLLGGLDLGEGATATVDIATNRSAVFTSRDFGDKPGQVGCISNRFNRAIGGTTRGTITHNETFLFSYYASGVRPFGNVSNQVAYAVGEFYVEETAAGKWIFAGACDDWVQLWVDGELALATAQTEMIVTNELTAGWHSFRHLALDNAGSFGRKKAYGTIGYKNPAVLAYKPFCVTNVTMRPAADFGDPNNANTVRWSHFKGTSATASASTFKGELDWDFCLITNNLQMLQWYGNTDPEYFNTYTVNRYDGWFLVTAENADKEWTFRTQYDDRGALWIDGVDTGLNGTNKNTLVYSVTLPRGWHHFQIRTLDNTGNAGPWSGKGNAVSYQVAGGAQTLFSEQTLQLTVCPDGYVQGGVTLASGATLSNGATENAAVIYGDVTAMGMGATISGPFKFEGGTLAFKNVAPATTNLANVLAFSNVPADMLASVGAITVDYADKPTRGKIPVCPLYGLTEEAVPTKVTVTVAGVPVDNIQVKVKDGCIMLQNTSGTLLFFR